MSKLKLGSPPKTFSCKVEITLLDGNTADVVLEFKYRTRKELGLFIDEFIKSATKDTPKKKKDTEFTLSDVLSTEDEANVKYILQIAEGWDLEEVFNEESVNQLISEFPSASIAIGEAYIQALTKGRTKN